jgi:DNA-binding transcriptional ArsR family regulator
MADDPQRDLADAYYPELARIGKAISSPIRLEILDLLRQGPRSVDDIAAELGLSSANASQHLKLLRGARLLESSKDGQRVYYRVSNDDVCRFFFSLQTVADQQLAEMGDIRRLVTDDDASLSVEDVTDLARSGKAVVVDVRAPIEFEAGHMAGSINIPLAEVAARAGELPKSKDVVVYCRGVYCSLALDAVRVFRDHGLRAHRLPLGVIEMRGRRWRIERGPAATASTTRGGTRARATRKKKPKKRTRK